MTILSRFDCVYRPTNQQVSPFQITLYCGGGNSLDAAPQAACGLIGPEWSARGNTSKLFHNNTWNKKDAPRLLGLNTSEPHPLPPVPPRPVRCVAPSPFSTQTGWPACKTTDKSALTVHNHQRLPSSLPVLGRTVFGDPGAYKPWATLAKNGDVLVISREGGASAPNWTANIFRSRDNGTSFAGPTKTQIKGGEFAITTLLDGTIVATCNTSPRIHRSTDHGSAATTLR